MHQDHNTKNIHFNISHSHDYGIIAISYDNEVGIDIEKVTELSDMDSIAEYTFSKKEVKFYKKSEKKHKVFFDIWTQKEAIVKASGEGLSLGLKDWSINPYTDEYIVLAKKSTFKVQKLELAENYSGALAIKKT